MKHKLPDEFGKWATPEERMFELNSRLIAWAIEARLEDLFAAACRRYLAGVLPTVKEITEGAPAEERLNALPLDLLLTMFESTLDDLDNVLELSWAVEDAVKGDEGHHEE